MGKVLEAKELHKYLPKELRSRKGMHQGYKVRPRQSHGRMDSQAASQEVVRPAKRPTQQEVSDSPTWKPGDPKEGPPAALGKRGGSPQAGSQKQLCTRREEQTAAGGQ